jgi:ADP-ribose pyrophosphatase YjhB (NUDIX family)
MARLSNEEYVQIYAIEHGYGVVRACIDLLIMSPEAAFSVIASQGALPTFSMTGGGIALVKRDILPEMHHWHLPGGRVDTGETPQSFADRITPKDLEINVKVLGPVSGASASAEVSKMEVNGKVVDITVHSLMSVYLCKALSKDIRGNEEGHEVGWFTEVPTPGVPHHMILLKNLGFLK